MIAANDRWDASDGWSEMLLSKPDALWALSWDDETITFRSFAEAREALLQELWWLAEDLKDESTFVAWDKVRNWELDFADHSIAAGQPPGIYTIRLIEEADGK